MKVGFSFGRCVRDIVQGKVDIADVVVIVARTKMNSEDIVKMVIDTYNTDFFGPLRDLDLDQCRTVGLTLWRTGKIHQPRIYNSTPIDVADDFVWMDLAPTTDSADENVKEAWSYYRSMLALNSTYLPATGPLL